MMRWALFGVLLAALLATSVGVVALRHESRQLFGALQQVERERDAAQVEWSRLQLEQAWLAEAGRVEDRARESLDMERPEQVSLLLDER